MKQSHIFKKAPSWPHGGGGRFCTKMAARRRILGCRIKLAFEERERERGKSVGLKFVEKASAVTIATTTTATAAVKSQS